MTANQDDRQKKMPIWLTIVIIAIVIFVFNFIRIALQSR